MMQRSIVRILSLAACVAVLAAGSAFAQSGAEKPKEIEIGKKAPLFKLKGVDGKEYALADQLKKNKAVVVTFTCNTCPVAKAYEDRLIALQKEFKDHKVQIIAINSNSPKVQPGDSFENMQKRAKDKKFNFPYVFDETEEVAKAYGAIVTPHIFLVSSEGKVVYRGAIDNNNNEKRADEHYLKDALHAVLEGKDIKKTATKARGCTIKWSRS